MVTNQEIGKTKTEIKKIGLDNRRYVMQMEKCCGAIFSPMRYTGTDIIKQIQKQKELSKKHAEDQEKLIELCQKLILQYNDSKNVELKVPL